MKIKLSFLRAHKPLDFLATLGILQVLSEDSRTNDFTVWWESEVATFIPVIETKATEDEVMEVLVDDFVYWKDSSLLGNLPNKLPTEEFLPALEKWGSKGAKAWAVFTSLFNQNLTMVHKKIEVLQQHPLIFTSRQSKLIPIVGDIVDQFLELIDVKKFSKMKRVSPKEKLQEFFAGKGSSQFFLQDRMPWLYFTGSQLSSARTGPRVNERDPILEWFGAFRMFPLLPSVQQGSKLKIGNKIEKSWFYPIWDTPLSYDLMKLVLNDSGILSLSKDERTLRGYSQVFKASWVTAEQGKDVTFVGSVPVLAA